MKFGTNIRNWGPTGHPAMIAACARIADESTLDSIWINDHIGLPPAFDDNPYGISAEMSHILDPLGVACYLAGITQRIRFGTGVLILPYRPALPTAKWIATIQELSAGRFLLGTGVGYVEEEFRALGVPRNQRGAISDDILGFLRECAAGEIVERNATRLVVRPRLKMPPIYVGGAPSVAIPRAVRFGDGWMPVGFMPEVLQPHVDRLKRLAAEAGRSPPEVVQMKTLPLSDAAAARDLARAYRDVGVTHLVHTQAYPDEDSYREVVDRLCNDIAPALR